MTALRSAPRCEVCGQAGADVAASDVFGGTLCSRCYDAVPGALERGDQGERGDLQGERAPEGRGERRDGPLVLDGQPRVRWTGKAIAALARTWGVGADGSLPCPLPGHVGRATIGVPYDDAGAGEPRLRCCRGRWRSLGETRAAIAYGEDKKRSNIELAVWTRRLAYEHGAFSPIAVPLPLLRPEHDSAHARRAREGFALLTGLRWADHEPRPVAWSVRFADAWCAFRSMQSAHEATRAIVESYVIVEAERRGSLRLYLPGPLPSRPVGGDGRPPTPRGRGGRRDGWDPDELAEAIIREFDAVEIGAEVEPRRLDTARSLAADCRYRREHVGREWRLAAGGPWCCGVCHPPATTEIVWRSGVACSVLSRGESL